MVESQKGRETVPQQWAVPSQETKGDLGILDGSDRKRWQRLFARGFYFSSKALLRNNLPT